MAESEYPGTTNTVPVFFFFFLIETLIIRRQMNVQCFFQKSGPIPQNSMLINPNMLSNNRLFYGSFSENILAHCYLHRVAFLQLSKT